MSINYRNLGRSGARVSQLCLGTMMFGGPTNEADSHKIIHKALDLGINFLDTANMYSVGESERVVGRGIAGKREKIILATKGRNKMGDGPNEQGGSRVHLMHELNASLKRLNTDYVDIYYVHAPDYSTPIDETLRACDDMVRSGKVHYIACSNFRGWRVMEALGRSDLHGWNRFTCVQPLYNLVNRDIEVELLPLCKEHGLGVVTYSPLARGILTGKYEPGKPFPEGSRAARNDVRMRQAELRDESLEAAAALKEHCHKRGVSLSHFAISWALANPIITSVILGPRTMEQFDDNLGCLGVEITSEDEAFVDALIPPGEHSGKGFRDPLYPVLGR